MAIAVLAAAAIEEQKTQSQIKRERIQRAREDRILHLEFEQELRMQQLEFVREFTEREI